MPDKRMTAGQRRPPSRPGPLAGEPGVRQLRAAAGSAILRDACDQLQRRLAPLRAAVRLRAAFRRRPRRVTRTPASVCLGRLDRPGIRRVVVMADGSDRDRPDQAGTFADPAGQLRDPDRALDQHGIVGRGGAGRGGHAAGRTQQGQPVLHLAAIDAVPPATRPPRCAVRSAHSTRPSPSRRLPDPESGANGTAITHHLTGKPGTTRNFSIPGQTRRNQATRRNRHAIQPAHTGKQQHRAHRNGLRASRTGHPRSSRSAADTAIRLPAHRPVGNGPRRNTAQGSNMRRQRAWATAGTAGGITWERGETGEPCATTRPFSLIWGSRTRVGQERQAQAGRT
jgi:hypothetical protein